ncbi:MAG: hypothetical protein ACRDS0_21370 [Pseudonocardiaceae bacterium]
MEREAAIRLLCEILPGHVSGEALRRVALLAAEYDDAIIGP